MGLPVSYVQKTRMQGKYLHVNSLSSVTHQRFESRNSLSVRKTV